MALGAPALLDLPVVFTVSKRCPSLLKALAAQYESYGSDLNAAHPSAALPAPMSKIIWHHHKLDCRVVWINEDKRARLNKLSAVESVLGYRYFNPWWKEKQSRENRKKQRDNVYNDGME